MINEKLAAPLFCTPHISMSLVPFSILGKTYKSAYAALWLQCLWEYGVVLCTISPATLVVRWFR